MGERPDNPFQIAQPGNTPPAHDIQEDQNLSPAERVARMVSSSDVFVFMKGDPRQPMCGFSANTVAMLNNLGVPYATFDVLSDESIRSAAKTYGQWPTFPQVYFKGELVGGNDIISEMYTSGELTELLAGGR